MSGFDSAEQRRAVVAYRKARREGLTYEKAYDSALEAYCTRLKVPKGVKAQVDVGVLIAHAQRKYGAWVDGHEA